MRTETVIPLEGATINIHTDRGVMVVRREQATAERDEDQTRVDNWWSHLMADDFVPVSQVWHRFESSRQATEAGSDVNVLGAEMDYIRRFKKTNRGFEVAAELNLPPEMVTDKIDDEVHKILDSRDDIDWFPKYGEHLKELYLEIITNPELNLN